MQRRNMDIGNLSDNEPISLEERLTRVSREPTPDELADFASVVGGSVSEYLQDNGYRLLVAAPSKKSDLYRLEQTKYLIPIGNRLVYIGIMPKPDRTGAISDVGIGFSYADDEIKILDGTVSYDKSKEEWNKNFTEVGEELDTTTLTFFRSLGEIVKRFECRLHAFCNDTRRLRLYEAMVKRAGITNLTLIDGTDATS